MFLFVCVRKMVTEEKDSETFLNRGSLWTLKYSHRAKKTKKSKVKYFVKYSEGGPEWDYVLISFGHHSWVKKVSVRNHISFFMSEEPWASDTVTEKLDLSRELHSEGHPKITQNWWKMSRGGDRMIGRSLEKKSYRSVLVMHKVSGMSRSRKQTSANRHGPNYNLQDIKAQNAP